MIYLIYFFLAIDNIFVTLFALIIAPILPLFAVQKEGWMLNHSQFGLGPRLPDWLSWFMTPDNSLDGDAGAIERNGTGYLAKVLWLWRNPAYSFGIRYLNAPYTTKCYGDKTIKDNDNAKSGWLLVLANGLFQFTLVIPIGFSICIYCNFGWNIRALVDDNVQPKPDPYQATFVFSPRFSGYR